MDNTRNEAVAVKLCIISTIPGTVNSFWGKQLKFLSENNFEITVISSGPASDRDQKFIDSWPENVNFVPVAMPRVISPLQDLRAFRAIYKIIKQNEFEIVQYVTPKAALLGSVASWLARVPVRLYLMWGLYYVSQTGFKRFLFKTSEKIACKCSTAIAPDSKGNVKFAIEERLCKASKIDVVGHGSANGVDTERFDPEKLYKDGRKIRKELDIPDGSKVFGSIAATVRDKGINELVEAFDAVSKSNPNTYLLYVGQQAQKDPVKDSTLKSINDHPKIINLGWQTEPEKYLAAMDIFVLPTYREGFGVVNIEASAMELPVITTDVPGPQESIVNGETGILVPAKTVQPLIDSMQELLDKPEYAERLGKAGRKRVNEFYEQKTVWKTIVEHRLKLLKRK